LYLYEGMFLLDNQVVREDWKKAKAIVTDLIGKHGGKVKTARRWDERKLAYPIKNRHRGTYLIAYYEIDGAAAPNMRRDLDLNERVLRYLMLSKDAMPEGEMDLAAAEESADFAVPAPPPDDAPESAPMRRREEGEEHEIFVPDLENLGADDEDQGARARAKTPETKAPAGA
jgi:small subunit ribosomal protein S6